MSHSTPSLPWDLLEYIYSFCDTSTLLDLSLLSFESWQMAGLLLYETVKITSLDALKSLFYLDLALSARLTSSPPTLTRIKTLTLDIPDWAQTSDPFLERYPVYDWCGYESDDDPDAPPRPPPPPTPIPHRLLRASPNGLSLRTLILPQSSDVNDYAAPSWGFLWFFGDRLFPHLNPHTVIHPDSRPKVNGPNAFSEPRDGPGPPQWNLVEPEEISPAYLPRWTNLDRVVNASSISLLAWDGQSHRTEALYACWTPPEGLKERRKLELVFDLSAWADWYESGFASLTVGEETTKLRCFLGCGGVTRESAELVTLRATLRVDVADETVVRKDVDGLEDWMRELVVVETV